MNSSPQKKWLCRPSGAANEAFTLVEMLVVIAIAGILVALSGPALTSLSMSGNVNHAVNGISLDLDEARAYAMSHNTYVWVGFSPNTSTGVLAVGAVAGTTGDAGDLGSPSTYTPITHLQTFNNFSLKSSISISGMASNGQDIGTSTVGKFYYQAPGGNTITFTEILQISPQGEAVINPSGNTPHWIQIGLQPTLRSNDPNVAVFQVAGLTGQVRVFRP
jgi:prepilin-type N-terminal cleavage/methylation domain-containing protein